MKELEKFESLSASLKEHKNKIPQLEAALKAAEADQSMLDEVALRTEVLKEIGWKDKALTAQRNKENCVRIQEEIKKSQAAIPLLSNEIENIKREVIAEIKESYRDRYEKAVRAFAKKLKEAEALEREMIGIRDAANNEVDRVWLNHQAFPSLHRVTVANPRDLREYGPANRFFRECKKDKIDI
jgi:hypothetical protein